MESVEGARACCRELLLSAWLFSSVPQPPPPPIVADAPSCYTFFELGSDLEGKTTQSQVSPGNAGQSTLHLFRGATVSLSLKERRAGLGDLWVLRICTQHLLQC